MDLILWPEEVWVQLMVMRQPIQDLVSTNRVMDLLEAIIIFQRDNGNRTDRKLARLKYTIDNFGLEAFKLNIEKRSEVLFKPAKDFQLKYRSDLLGFRQDMNKIGTILFLLRMVEL